MLGLSELQNTCKSGRKVQTFSFWNLTCQS